MKICVVNPNFYRSSGVTVAIRRLYEGAVDLPMEWQFVNCQHGSSLEVEPITWLRRGNAPEIGIKLMSTSPITLLKAMFKLATHLKEQNIDVVHVHHRRLAWLVGWICLWTGIPLVYTGHLAYGKARLQFLRFVRKAISISQSVENDMRRSERTSLPIVRIANACPTPSTPPAAKRTLKRVVLCVARLEPVKNHEALLNAWASISRSHVDAELWLLGEGSQKQSLEQKTRDLHTEHSVKFLGFDPNPEHLVDQCDFLVLASKVEGLPLVVLEAALRGKATLLSDADGNRDCVPPTATLPTLFAPDDHRGLVNSLERWLSASDDELQREGQRFCDHWTPLAAPPFVARKHMDVYLSAMRAT